MKKLLNDESDWDDVDCPEVMDPCCLIWKIEVCAGIKIIFNKKISVTWFSFNNDDIEMNSIFSYYNTYYLY